MSQVNNPYETPRGELERERFGEFGEIRFFTSSCRIGRLRMLAHFQLTSFVAYFVLVIAMIVVFASDMESNTVVAPLIRLASIFYIAFVAMFWIIMIQRLHDINRSGWFSLLCIIPFVNIIFALCLTFVPSNDYGDHPPPNRWWHWILGLMMPLGIVAMLASIAIPAYQDYSNRVAAAKNNAFESNPL